MNNQDKIKQLKEELKKYAKVDEKRLNVMKDKQKISELKQQIRKKKYAGIKVIGKNMGLVTKAIGKGMSKFIGEEQNTKDRKKKYDVDEIIKKLPQ